MIMIKNHSLQWRLKVHLPFSASPLRCSKSHNPRNYFHVLSATSHSIPVICSSLSWNCNKNLFSPFSGFNFLSFFPDSLFIVELFMTWNFTLSYKMSWDKDGNLRDLRPRNFYANSTKISLRTLFAFFCWIPSKLSPTAYGDAKPQNFNFFLFPYSDIHWTPVNV